MIPRYNRHQMLLAIGSLLLGLTGYTLAYLFFRHMPALVASYCGTAWDEPYLVLGGLGALGVISWSGWRIWRAGGGFSGYRDSGFYHELDLSTSGGANVVDFYAHRVTAWTHLLSQIFLAGPLMVLRAVRHLRNRIPPSADTETLLADTLARLRAANKWQSLSDYPGSEVPILLLARMGLIDFSSVRGPRFKASPPESNP